MGSWVHPKLVCKMSHFISQSSSFRVQYVLYFLMFHLFIDQRSSMLFWFMEILFPGHILVKIVPMVCKSTWQAWSYLIILANSARLQDMARYFERKTPQFSTPNWKSSRQKGQLHVPMLLAQWARAEMFKALLISSFQHIFWLHRNRAIRKWWTLHLKRR